MDSVIKTLDERERQTVFECLCNAEKEEFFPEWEFETLFGITKKQLSSVREKWPEVDTRQSDVATAIVGAMNHLLGYPHGKNEQGARYIGSRPDAIRATLDKLLALGL
jgi:hypothetical protein